jgi:hypothetical protein
MGLDGRVVAQRTLEILATVRDLHRSFANWGSSGFLSALAASPGVANVTSAFLFRLSSERIPHGNCERMIRQPEKEQLQIVAIRNLLTKFAKLIRHGKYDLAGDDH